MGPVKIKITVTTTHIRKGHKGHLYLCPIALAAKSAGFVGPQVMIDEINVGSHDNNANYSLPRSAQRFIKAFDKGRSVKPFAFFISRRI